MCNDGTESIIEAHVLYYWETDHLSFIYSNSRNFEYLNRPTDDVPKIKILCIGAGISGILSAIKIPQRLQNFELQIYEKSPDLGGTWYENHYPGLACDIPAAAYQLSFESNTQWSAYYAPGPEIQQYWKRVAEKYDVYKYMNFNSQIVEARWNEETGLWTVQIKDTKTGEIRTDSGNVLISATGILNDWSWPKIPGLHDFKGHLVHSANWDHSYDMTGKNIALIGGGSSGIQLLPNMQPIVKHCDHYMKGKTWIAYRVPGKEVPGMNPENLENFQHTEEELKRFREDPEEYLKFRCAVEDALNTGAEFIFNGSDLQKGAQKLYEETMSERLKNKPGVYESLKPDYAPGCRRLTPGPGYLNAIAQPNVDFISTAIKEVTATGIVTEDGKLREVDAIITATGFNMEGNQRFPTYGLDGITLGEVWDPTPEAYLSMCPAKMPNYFIYLGPNGGPGTGSTIILLEQVAEYICKAVGKLQREGLKSMVAKEEPIKHFVDYVDKYMEGVVYGNNCRSWFKRGRVDGRVVYVYPGGSMSGLYVLKNPRWEDFTWTRNSQNTANMWAWLGNGTTCDQRDGRTTSHYLRNIDYPPVPKKSVTKETLGIENGDETNDTTTVAKKEIENGADGVATVNGDKATVEDITEQTSQVSVSGVNGDAQNVEVLGHSSEDGGKASAFHIESINSPLQINSHDGVDGLAEVEKYGVKVAMIADSVS